MKTASEVNHQTICRCSSQWCYNMRDILQTEDSRSHFVVIEDRSMSEELTVFFFHKNLPTIKEDEAEQLDYGA